MSLDIDKVPAGFEFEGAQHPHLILNMAPTVGEMRACFAMGQAEEYKGELLTNLLLLFVVREQAGKWSLTPGGDFNIPELDLESTAAVKKRLEAFSHIEQNDWSKLGDIARRAMGLSEGERGKLDMQHG